METPLAIALLLLSAVAFLRSSAWVLPCLTLAALTRYELVVPLIVIGAACLITRRERSGPGVGAIPPRFALESKPDLILTYDIFGEAVIASQEIQAAYEDLRFDPVLRNESTGDLAPVWGSHTLHVSLTEAESAVPRQSTKVFQGFSHRKVELPNRLSLACSLLSTHP